jgi:cytochrome c peroxidase
LPLSVGLFKTPTLRDLGQSPPYFHDGSRDTLEDALQHYRDASDAARAGHLRNGAPELANVVLSTDDVAALVDFLRALDEDYE